MTSVRTLPLVAFIVLSGVAHAHRLPAQTAVDSTRRATSAPHWTAQEISDACNHKAGARMRLYGCSPEAFIPRRGEPLYVIDGQPLPTDTIGPRRLAREGILQALRPEDLEEITIIKGDSAVARFGPTAQFGAVLMRTKRLTPRRNSVPDRAPGV
jgi:hypothetical protein